MDVEDAAAQLYGLRLEEFVPARDALAKRVKSEGSADVAAQIKKLRKPTLAAWLANQLAREHRSEVDKLVLLGEQMRKATASLDGARLRELTTDRKDIVDSLLDQATELAGAAEQQVSDDVSQTLTETLLAAVADPQAAEDLRAGRLTRGLQHVGFGPVTTDESAEVISLAQARAAREQQPEPATGHDERAGPEREETERERQETERAWQEARREFEEAESAVDAAEDRVDDLEAELDERRRGAESAESAVERLRAELDSAREELDRTRTSVKAGQDDLEQARTDAETARRRRRDAKRRLSQFDV